MPGLRITAARGFYNVRPYLALQMPLSHMGSFLYWSSSWLEILPFNFLLGAEYVMYMGKLAVSPYAGVGLSYIHVETVLSTFETDFLSHVGGQGGARVSYLLNRNTRVFADLGYETWIAISDFWGNTSYGGVSAGLGIAFKL
jgi:hypothetical protein